MNEDCTSSDKNSVTSSDGKDSPAKAGKRSKRVLDSEDETMLFGTSGKTKKESIMQKEVEDKSGAEELLFGNAFTAERRSPTK